MPVSGALQAAALAFALLMTGPTPLQPSQETTKSILHTARRESQRLHCRLYFGCAPIQKTSAESAED